MKWGFEKIGNLCRIKHGFAFKGEFFTDSGEFVLLSPGNFNESGGLKLKGDKEKYYGGEIPSSYILDEGDLLIVMTDLIQNAPILGGAAFVPESNKFLHNQRLGKVENLNHSRIDIGYLYYCLNDQSYRALVRSSATGATVRHTAPERIYNCVIPLPPLTTQQKIASILSAYDGLIENNLKRIRLLEEAAQHLYREWFVRFRFPGWEEVKVVDGLPEGWEKVNLYEFANLKMGFPFKAEDFNEEKNGTPVIRIRDIPNHWTNSYSKSSTSDDYWVEKNDIVIGMDGFFYTDVWGGQRGYLVQRVCRIRPNDERLNGYLLEAIRGPIKYFEKTISGATVAHLGAKHLKEIEIIKPPEKFVPELEVLNYMVEQRVNLLLQNQKLKEARDILLPRLMNQTIEL